MLGEPDVLSPLASGRGQRRTSLHWVDRDDRVLFDDTVATADGRGVPIESLPALEPGGPRSHLYFDPRSVRAGIVSCGGLCPGINDVIRGLVLQLSSYGVRSALGYRNSYLGLVPPAREAA